jgi:hypothetical protein
MHHQMLTLACVVVKIYRKIMREGVNAVGLERIRMGVSIWDSPGLEPYNES